jgi:hypothetical protein
MVENKQKTGIKKVFSWLLIGCYFFYFLVFLRGEAEEAERSRPKLDANKPARAKRGRINAPRQTAATA